MNINDRIKQLRVEILKISQVEFLTCINRHDSHFSTLSRYENNKHEPPVKLLVDIIRYLNVYPNWLFLGDGYIFTAKFTTNERVIGLKVICNRIEKIRYKLNLSVKEFSNLLGVSYINKTKTDDFYSLDLFLAIINIGISPNWLFCGVGNMFLDGRKLSLPQDIKHRMEAKKKRDTHDTSTFHGRVHILRLHLGMNRVEFSKLLGYEASAISHLESGNFTLSFQKLSRLIEATGVSLKWIFCGEGDVLSKEKIRIDSEGLGRRISEVRVKKGLTQKQLGEILGCTYINILNIEKGKYLPSQAFISNLIEKLDVDVNWLLTGNTPLVAVRRQHDET